ncbi:uncharacterized protein L969DRAFT_89686 [Mixia osmundae IAM 14324]|uniref:uncharacterized protein n=1 Tax=Mixia osmundae (strain CBS 9802 / IAM 14324 / JCM 22182 / KY 12970) TaxID=764103 RepID=UPI0004A546AC|nr:uncharacterized protein L969DRAFT_89686 [Mixia osmundae IAM 14324]KEI37717.1 hypothetical protein L969DRAFT_89686 [Mixia osmundae IAM 14324]
MSSPSALLTTHVHSNQIQVLSVARLAIGGVAFFAPAFFTQRFFGFTQRTSSGSSATASTTSTKAGSPEETTLAIRLFATREVVFGLLLRDSSSSVVERALQVGLINSVLDIGATVFGFVEGNLSREIATAVGGFAALSALFQAYILNR